MLKYALIVLMLLPVISGCAAGSATAGYSLKAGSSDDLSSKPRREIIDEAVSKAYDKTKIYVDENSAKTKTYIDENFVRKDGK